MKADPTPADEATSYAIRFPDDPEIFSQTEAQQLVAEELVEKWEKGKMRLLWDNKKRRNEALDCLVYAYAALRVSVQRWQLDLAVLAKSPGRRDDPANPERTGSEAVRRSEWLQSLNCRRCVRRALIY
ncbi:terminase large subunit (Gp2) [Escherichia coli]|uniref:Terminase large subunit (Gp2) n=1 Tax=Escherichia coli TaxID=562 RepID=A0AB38GRU9_ECOLX|nr:terminase large subunit (Gp2) [Escherichia coli]